ncbi:MAG: TIGR04290 family methyltransferase [Chitinivibrionales bacterium]|nr:TIGR04290 family methyltransferase [Chitinivibrionales bacterium]
MPPSPANANSADTDTGRQVAALAPWFHNLHLPDGTQTAPDHFLGDFPSYKWRELAACLPQDLSGWTVLDIGCNAGYYSFELAGRGATVTGIDSNPHYLAQARWAAQQFGLAHRVQFAQMQVHDLARHPTTYDLVLFLGVFYHLRYPLLALDIIVQKVRKLLLFQTLSTPGETTYECAADYDINDRAMMNDPGWPRMAFIEGRLANDPTNWWAPNHACIEAMMRTCGMRVVGRPGKETYLCEPDGRDLSCVRTWNAAEYHAATGVDPA